MSANPEVQHRVKVTVADLFAPWPPYVHVAEHIPSPTAPWLIYLLTSKSNNLEYVGVTRRTLKARLKSHGLEARRHRPVLAGGLMDAVRTLMARGETIQEGFRVQVLATAKTADEARALEQRWIMLRGSRKPNGLNHLPGGSLGGSGNACKVEIRLPTGHLLRYFSIYEAIGAKNQSLRDAGRPIIEPGIVYARLEMGWPPIEALEYAPHRDRRGKRPMFKYQGEFFDNIKGAVLATGVLTSTLRSKLHRRHAAGSYCDLAYDLRRSAPGRPRPGCLPSLGLRFPGEAQPMATGPYAAHAGVSKSTVLQRWHAAQENGLNPDKLSPDELLAWMTKAEDRRTITKLELPDGRRWIGGERELIRRVSADATLASSRIIPLSESGVRRRLRSLTERERDIPGHVSWAFGFSSKPDAAEKVSV